MNSSNTDPRTQLAAELRAGAEHLGTHRQAAVDLLIEHDVWLRRGGFVRDCVHRGDDGTAVIRFAEAAEAVADGRYRGSTSELAVLARGAVL